MTKKQKKNIKAWAVIIEDIWMKNPEGTTEHARIFSTKRECKERYPCLKVVPCEIKILN